MKKPDNKNHYKEFLKKYKALCDEYKLRIVVTPGFKARDDGTWSLILQTSIGEISEIDNKK